MLYLPVSQNAPSEVVLVVRAAGEAADLGTAVQKVLTSLDSEIPVGELRSVEGEVSKTLAYPRFRARLAAAFAGLALVLALVGRYGVLAQVVAQRTREIGIRIALGARRESVSALILSQGMWLVGKGLTFGLVAATWLRRLLATMLYDARNGDLRLLALVFFSFCAAAFVAIYVPARRATHVNPVVALRNE
jgi:putative ABC transport system permease protein